LNEFLENIDRNLFLFLNGINSPFFDSLMFKATQGMIYLPLYLFFLFFVVRKYRWNALLVLAFAALMILTGDQLSNLVKDSVQRLRPSRQPDLVVHIVEAYKGGTYGFYSAHASNTFCVVVFLIVTLGRKYWYVYVPAILWSLLMSYSRIYLGVHYPGDVLAGWIAGGVIGFLFGKAFLKLMEIISKKEKDKTIPV
jgi:undecaprenyl-diphosphatase